MRRILLLLAALPLWGAMAPHPRVFLTPTRLTTLKAKATANETYWVSLKTNMQLTQCNDTPYSMTVAAKYAPPAAMVAAVAYSYADDAERAAANFNVTPGSSTYYQKYLICALNRVWQTVDYYSPKRRSTFTATAGQTDFTLANAIFWYPYRVRVVSGATTTDSLATAGAIGVWGDAQTKDWKYEHGSATLHRTGAALLAGDTVEVIYHGEGDDCISGTYGQTVANDGTYGYLSGATWTTPPYIPCTLQARSATTITSQTLNEVRNIGWIPAVTMDWLYDQFTADEIDAIVGWSRSLAWYTGSLTGSTYSPDALIRGFGPGANSHSGQVRTLGLIGIATHGDNPSDSGDTNYEINRSLGWLRGYAGPYFNGTPAYPDLAACAAVTHNCASDGGKYGQIIGTGDGIGGALPEGQEYSPLTVEYFVELFDAWATSGAAGVSIAAEFPNLLNDFAWWMIYKTTPTRVLSIFGTLWQAVPYGDMQKANHNLTASDRTAALFLTSLLGSSDLGNYLRKWIDTTQTATPATDARHWDALFRTSTWTTADYSGIDTGYVASGQKLVTARSDWSTTATQVVYRGGGRWLGHEHPDAGGYAILRKGAWLTTDSRGYGTPWMTAATQNALTYRPTGQTRDYGSLKYEQVGDPTFKSKLGTGWAYARSGLENGYRATANLHYTWVTQYDREWTYFSPDVVVIVDRLKYNTETTSYFQMTSPPANDGTRASVSGNQVTMPLGTQKLFLTAVTPATTFSTRSNNAQLTPDVMVYNEGGFTNKIGVVSGAINDSTLSIATTGFANLYQWVPMVATIDSERILICAFSKVLLTVCTGGRGYDGTTAAAHSNGVNIYGSLQDWTVRSAWTLPANTLGYAAHVIEAADSGGSASTVTGIDAGNHYAVQIAAASPRVYVFPKARQDYSSASVAVTYAGTGGVLFTGLTAGTYSCTLNAVEFATPTVGTDGTLYAETTAGTVACLNGASPIAPTITTTSVPSGTVGTSYNTTLVATGDPTITWMVASGSLPPGLSLSSEGVISGTPTAAQVASFTVRASNAGGSGDQPLSLTIAAAPSVGPSGYSGTLKGQIGGN